MATENTNFPTTIVDGFFDNPDDIVNFANTLEYEADSIGHWPGVRSKPLSLVRPAFFEMCCKKLFSLFYNYNHESATWEIDLRFQKISNKYEKGWVHTDPCVLTFIIYLTKGSLKSGTSICRLKTGYLGENLTGYNKEKSDWYLGKLSVEEGKKYIALHNEPFEDTLNVASVYNRLLAFDSGLFHRAQNFVEVEGERLTLIGFVHKLGSGQTPVNRMRCTY